MSAVTIALTILFALGVIWACSPQDPSAWYPKGEASVVAFLETTESGVKLCSVTLKLSNTGLSKIRTSTVSLSLVTGARTYLSTYVSTLAILPGKSVYETKTVAYADPGEATEQAKITVAEQFYE